MRWLKSVSYIFSPLIASLVLGILLVRFQLISGTWFVLVVLIGLIVSMANSVIFAFGVRKK
jgi:hypothetical protein